MRSFVFAVLVGCSAEYQVLLDGQPQDGLAEAAANASPGSVVELQPITYTGGIVFPNDVTVLGHGATIQGSQGPLIQGGDLTLRDLTLIGGTGDDGASVQADALVLIDVEQRGAEGLVAIRSNRSIEATDCHLEHDGIAIEARSNLGRSRRVELLRLSTTGDLAVEADEATLVDVEAFQISTGGPNTRIETTTATGLTARGRALQAFGVEAQLGAFEVDEVTLSELHGGSWTVRADTVQGLDVVVDALEVDAEDAVLAELSADQIRLTASATAQVAGVRADHLLFQAPALDADDVEGRDVELAGLGLLQDIRAVGAHARLRVNQGRLRAALLASNTTPVELELVGADVRNLLVFEPPESASTRLIDVTSYATVAQSTFRVGQRTALAPPVPVGWHDSIVYGVALGDIVGGNIFDDTVVFSETETLPLRAGLTIADPLFLPDSPVPNPLSDWTEHGALAGPYGPIVQQRWDALAY